MPPEALSPEDVRAVIAAATCERDQLLLRVLWATGARISEVLVLRPMDVQRDSLILPNCKNPNLTIKRVFLPGAELGLTGELLLWAKKHNVSPPTNRCSSHGKVGETVRVTAFSVDRRGLS